MKPFNITLMIFTQRITINQCFLSIFQGFCLQITKPFLPAILDLY